jgi:glycosyltransferase involved in cell wall biosynthesis
MPGVNPLNVLVDGRAFLDARSGGVFEYVTRLTSALRQATPHSYRIWTNARRSAAVPAASNAHTRWPNKLVHAGTRLIGLPKLDRLAGGSTDLAWMPNPHFAAFSRGLPLVLTVHDLSFERYPEFFSLKRRAWHRAIGLRALCRRADAVLAVSEHTKRDLVELYGLPPERVHVTYEGCGGREGEDGGAVPGPLPERFILHIGSLEPRKNHLALIRAFERLKSGGRFSDLGLVLAGPPGWKNGEIVRAIELSRYREAIVRLGFVGDPEKRALYRNASVFAFPSFYEGFGLPPLEAMAAGTPVVASFAASLGEVVGEAGLLVDPYRPSELADALKAVLDSPALASELSRRGIERSGRFTWEVCAHKTAEAFAKIC